jgi:hypothetical protein
MIQMNQELIAKFQKWLKKPENQPEYQARLAVLLPACTTGEERDAATNIAVAEAQARFLKHALDPDNDDEDWS